MTSLRMAWTEIRRITATRTARIVVVALVLVPALYAGVYLYANHDPYGNLMYVPAAIVVEDTGATDTDGKRVDAGRRVADQLVEDGSFDWHEVDAADARRGVREGDYQFALVVPEDFSAALTSSGRYEPERARLQLVTNDANSYLSTSIANTVVAKVRTSLSQQVSETAADQFLLGISDLRAGLLRGAKGADRLADGLDRLVDGARTARAGANRLATGAGRLRDGSDELATGLGTLATSTADLPAQTRRLADGARRVADADQRIADIGGTAASAASTLVQGYASTRRDLVDELRRQGLDAEQRQAVLAVYDGLRPAVVDGNDKVRAASRALDRLAAGADRVADGNEALAANVPALVSGIDRARTGAQGLAGGADRLATGARGLADGLGDLADGAATARDGAEKLRDGLRDGARQVPRADAGTRKRIADTIADPVDLRSASQAQADSYGAGLAPYFLSLGAWIGGYVLFMLVRPLSRRALAANQSPLRIAVGGWLTPALIGVTQMVVVLSIVAFGVDIRPADFPGTLAFLLLLSVTFVAILHLLNAALGSTGQFLGLVLMVLQLVTAGGTFPWQTLPPPIAWLHHVLPMSRGVDGLRQLLYGGLSARVADDVVVLLAYLVGALVLTSIVARRQRVWVPKRIRPEAAL
ncbi:YhgE/Pip family protein [Nocardioides sp. MAHUQ-72]|uniref:YhgE/Pip family protein n=1 Tax=unclassified Nocardioides TaxID=2615069 RepID=UPI00360CA52B